MLFYYTHSIIMIRINKNHIIKEKGIRSTLIVQTAEKKQPTH